MLIESVLLTVSSVIKINTVKSGTPIQKLEKWNVNKHRGFMDVFALLRNWSKNYSYLIFVAQQPYAGLGRPTLEVSKSHADTS